MERTEGALTRERGFEFRPTPLPRTLLVCGFEPVTRLCDSFIIHLKKKEGREGGRRRKGEKPYLPYLLVKGSGQDGTSDSPS